MGSTCSRDSASDRSPTISVDAACAGFAQALSTALAYHQASLVEDVVLVASNRHQGLVDQSDARIAPLFGDGSGAFVMGAVPEGYGVLGISLFSFPEHIEALHTPRASSVPAGTDLLMMDGRTLKLLFSKALPEEIFLLLQQIGLTIDEVDHLIPHQANVRMLEELGEILGVDNNRISIVGRDTANTAAASIPLACFIRNQKQAFQRDDIVVIATGGAGLNGAVIALRWY